MEVELKYLNGDGFDWDEGNFLKLQKHGLSIVQIEEFFSQKVLVTPDQKHSKVEPRFMAFARDRSGRAIMAIFTWRIVKGSKLIRIISARYMHRKEILFYEKAKKKLEA